MGRRKKGLQHLLKWTKSKFLGLDLPYTLNTLFFGMERYRKKGRDMRWENVKYFITKIGWPPFPFSETSIIFSVKQQYTRSLIKIVSFHRDSISPIYFYFSEIHYFWYVFGKILKLKETLTVTKKMCLLIFLMLILIWPSEYS